MDKLTISGLCNPASRMKELHKIDMCSKSPTLPPDDRQCPISQNLCLHNTDVAMQAVFDLSAGFLQDKYLSPKSNRGFCILPFYSPCVDCIAMQCIIFKLLDKLIALLKECLILKTPKITRISKCRQTCRIPAPCDYGHQGQETDFEFVQGFKRGYLPVLVI